MVIGIAYDFTYGGKIPNDSKECNSKSSTSERFFSKVVPIYSSRNLKVVSSKVELSPIPSSILIFKSSSMFFVADVVILKYIFIFNGQLNHIY